MIEVKKKRNTEKIILCVIICLVICLMTGSFIYYNVKYMNNTPKEVETPKPSLKDDFYENINYETIKNATIPSDSGSWDKAYDAQKTIEKRQEELTNEILADPNYKNEDIDAMVELYTDYETRDKLGISELKPYLEMVDKANTIEEFNNVLLKLDKDLDLSVFFNYEDTNDYYDSTKTVLFILPNTIADVPYELFTESKYATYVPFIEKEMKKCFEIMEYPSKKIDDLIKQIIDFAKTIQGKSIIQGNITDIFDLYKKYTLEEINKEIKNIPIKRLLTDLKIDNQEFYLVPDMGHYKAIDEYFTVEHLPLLKEIVKMQIVLDFLPLTTKENTQFMIDLDNETSGTKKTLEENDKQMILTIKTSFISDELQKRYEAKYFTEEDKKLVADLVEDVKKYYTEIIKNCDWLSAATKEEALKKLENIKVNIGYQEKDKKDNDKYKPVSKANGGTLISNEIGENRFYFDKYHEVFEKEATLEGFNTLVVNAFYNPQNNSINFLAGFKEIYGNEKNYYKLLGYFGMVISHEISHAFDTNGSKFDENGKVKNWWTEEDKANYDKLTAKIKEYYNNYEYMGFKVDGNRTLSENIADLAAMKALVSIAESKGATNDDFKNLFEAYADLWVEKSNKETAQFQSLSDTHSPNKVRVNAVLSSIDKFYEVYDIKEGDKMYVAKEDRVGLW